MTTIQEAMARALGPITANEMAKLQEAVRLHQVAIDEMRWQLDVLRKLYNASLPPKEGKK